MILTRLASGVWGAVNAAVGGAYRRGWLKRGRVSVRTISIGNLQAGGAGKTPFVAALAREALARGQVPIILTRGYGGAWSANGGVIRPGQAQVPAAECGDEVKLLHRLVPQAWIGVGADRIASFAAAQAQGARPDLAILDDGFQHFRLIRDVDVVLMTELSRRTGLFREGDRALRRASLVVWSKGERPLDTGTVPQARVVLRPPKAEHGSRKYWLVSGVGNPDHLETSVREAGYRLEKHIRFPDHARYLRAHLEDLAASAAQTGSRLLTTGKDWVKWEELGFTNAEWIEPQIEWTAGREAWEKVVWG